MSLIALFKSVLASKLAIVTMIITLLWTLVDAKERFLNDSNMNQTKSTNNNIKILKLPTATEKLVSEVISQYEKYKTEQKDQTAIKEKGLSAIEQSLQSGELDVLFVGDKKLQLKAVFINDTAKGLNKINSILLQITNVNDGVAVIEKFTHLSTVYGYELNILNNIQVQLTKDIDKENVNNGTLPVNKTDVILEDNDKKKQVITLSMYKNLN